MATKAELLKQIDDAASQFGQSQTGSKNKKLAELNSLRNADAKRAAAMVLTSPQQQNQMGLTLRELEQLNAGKFQHGKTLLENQKKDDERSKRNGAGEDLRSLRSEYDYGSKRKFVDVLGNMKKQNAGNGLAGLEEFRNHEGAKNMEGASQKSRRLSQMSGLTSYKRRLAGMQQTAIGLNGPEGAQAPGGGQQHPLNLVDKKTGKTIQLTAEHLILLEQLSRQNDLSALTDEQQELLASIDFDELQDLDPAQISQILEQSGIAGQDTGEAKNKKRMFSFNYHDNSDDYKNLGTLHRENRTVDYFPQDEKQDFSTKPQILGKDMYEAVPAPEMTQEPAHGQSPEHPLTRRANVGFPKTTNQDFHGQEVFNKATTFGMQLDKQNFKKTNPYSAYVNAMFNQGVYVNPWQDQV